MMPLPPMSTGPAMNLQAEDLGVLPFANHITVSLNGFLITKYPNCTRD